MDIQKAIKYFDGYGSPYDDLVIQALEKQIPQPPEYKHYKENPSLWEIYHCQSCNAILLNYELYPTDYCNKCGQKLKGESE